MRGNSPPMGHGGKKGHAMMQNNLQHSKKATDSLCHSFRVLQTGICHIQEPYHYRGKIRGLGALGNVHCFNRPGEKPRACLITTIDVHTWPLTKFSNGDVAAIKTIWKHGTVVHASVYMASDVTCPPPMMTELVNHCNSNGVPLIIGCDANAHHTT